MPTVIKTKTYMCPNGIGATNCRFHRRIDNLPEDNMCPDCKLELVLATDPDDQCTTTIRDEADFDNPDLIEHGGNWITRQQADESDASELEGYLQKENERLFIERSAKGEVHVPLTSSDNHGWVAPVRKELSQEEREVIKQKIRDDIIKYKELEYNG